MKKILFGAIALMLVAGLASCSSSKKAAKAPAGMVEEAIPLSGAQYRSDADYYRAVQNGVSTERSTAQKIAMQNCRQDLAAAIQADMKVVIENYAKGQDTGLTAENKAQYQEMAYTAVNQQLRDVQLVEEKMFRQDNGSFRYYVCMQVPKAALEAAVEDALAKDAKLNLEFDRAQFKKVFEEQMSASAKK
ncbi:hypothetical protein [uncultured Alistipes sp.]|jgi:hypothetical protein|uniref:hypothetical protein n=1 Tax=uncultured Alistipes sp. TaxID=538949 RepID=UPI0025F987DC|nr:hypothetical protein [uncultured Alistipes sp.]